MPEKYRIPELTLGSKTASLVVALEPLRSKYLTGTTPPWIFFGLKNLFQTIESVTSARIEGNNTTIADFVEAARDGDKKATKKDSIKMIMNVERGIQEIEDLNMETVKFDKDFIFGLHRTVVDGLSPNNEGDDRAGAYRNTPRQITNSLLVLPAPADIRELMDELMTFINSSVDHQLDLVKIAMVHHRFVWIHPFGNGNGRVVRLLTYAMLAKAGYIDKDGARLLDPAAVFGIDKKVYYEKLAGADDLSDFGLVAWCEYMLEGLLSEVGKIDRLLDEDFTKSRIIVPAIEHAYEKQRITRLEKNMLLICVEKNIVSASDFSHLFPKGISPVNISLAIRKLKDQNLIQPTRPNARKYTLCMNRNAITTGIIGKLDENGFLPPLDSQPVA